MQVSASIAGGTVRMVIFGYVVFFFFFLVSLSGLQQSLLMLSAILFWSPFSVVDAICNAGVLVCLYTIGRRKREYQPLQNHLRPDPYTKYIPIHANRCPNTNRKLDCWLLLLKRPGRNGLQHDEGGAFFEWNSTSGKTCVDECWWALSSWISWCVLAPVKAIKTQNMCKRSWNF